MEDLKYIMLNPRDNSIKTNKKFITTKLNLFHWLDSLSQA